MAIKTDFHDHFKFQFWSSPTFNGHEKRFMGLSWVQFSWDFYQTGVGSDIYVNCWMLYLSNAIINFLWFLGNRVTMDPPWNSMEYHGPSMEIHGVPWNSMEFHGVPWIIHGNPMELHGVPWNSMDFHGIPWTSMGLFYTGPSSLDPR